MLKNSKIFAHAPYFMRGDRSSASTNYKVLAKIMNNSKLDPDNHDKDRE